jgi:PST family polysaccharide transporter
LGSVPGALLERNLQFGKLALVDVIEILVFSAVALPAAVWLKVGAWSFIAAVIVRSLITGFIFYLLQSWRPHLRLERVAAKEIFKFGVPYQLGILAAFFKDNMLALLIGPWLGPRTLGYLSFGFEQAKLPYMLSQMVARITFPAFARLQEDRAFLQRSLEWTIKLSFITCGAYTVITSILAPRLLVQVFGEKWEPAVLIYILLAGNFLGNYFTNPLVPLLTALGKPARGMRLMLIWTVTMWLLTLLLVALFGYIGAALASSVVTLFAAGAAVIEVRRLVQFSLWKALSAPLLALLPTSLLCLLLLPFLTSLWLTLAALFGAGLLYLVSVIGLDRATLLPEIKKILKKKIKNRGIN